MSFIIMTMIGFRLMPTGTEAEALASRQRHCYGTVGASRGATPQRSTPPPQATGGAMLTQPVAVAVPSLRACFSRALGKALRSPRSRSGNAGFPRTSAPHYEVAAE